MKEKTYPEGEVVELEALGGCWLPVREVLAGVFAEDLRREELERLLAEQAAKLALEARLKEAEARVESERAVREAERRAKEAALQELERLKARLRDLNRAE
ncbi:MAG: hypothetical protein NZ585_13935 [Chloracidobacterium sp.]|nr:hypothetical protein [Chloracidobacterium sp.]MDW8217947.1 hypothetical protein [Acidobacteriota bacterium]